MLYLRFMVGFVCAVALLDAGCSGRTYVTVDAQAGDAAHAPDGMLVLLSAPSVAIRPGEVAPIDVRCVGPSGAPQADAEITFAIEGAALDSTLSTLSMRTDADGRASGGIVAGTQATSFRVRVVSRAAALPLYVDVGVGTSFGTLVVHAPYDGSRVVTHRIVDVVPRARCADLASSPPEVGARAVPEGADALSIAGLPTTVHYAVLARAESELALTAMGCVDDVELTVDAITDVVVPYADTALSLDGRYDAQLSLDAAHATEVAFGIVAGTIETTSESRGGDASALLDALETELSARVSVAAGDALRAARTSDGLDGALMERLTTDGSAPTPVTVRWIHAAREAMAHPVVHAALAIAASTGGNVLTTESITTSDAADGTVSLVATSLGPDFGAPRPIALTADGTRDAVTLESLTIDVPLGALLLAWLDAVATSDGLVGSSGLYSPTCGTLREFVSATSAAAACDGACVEAACAAVVATELEDLHTAAALLDATTGALSLSGPLAAADADGDVRVDTLSGALVGAYADGGALALGPVTGTVEVTRAPAP